MNIKKHIPLLSILLPILIISAWMTTYIVRASSDNEITLRIGGFDPRDLLSGHYLRYRVNYGSSVKCPKNDGEWCLCLKKNKRGFGKILHQSQCHKNTMKSCLVKLKGKCHGRGFRAGIERFYFPEQHKDRLKVVPPKSTITIKVNDAGDVVVTGLQVNGTPLQDWLKNLKD